MSEKLKPEVLSLKSSMPSVSGSLKYMLQLEIGAKVMSTANINISDRLIKNSKLV